MSTDLLVIPQTDLVYPRRLAECLKDAAPPVLFARGNPELLDCDLLGIVSSAQCPGSLILQTYDLARTFKARRICAISGFHSPIEDEVLIHLLRGEGQIVMVYSRGIHHLRIPKRFQAALEANRVLLLSPFDAVLRRGTTATATFRNRIVIALATRVFVPHAAPGSKTEALCREAIGWGKPLLTLESGYNSHLISIGAVPISSL